MRKAFTLIELLIVVSIIAILALIAIPNTQEAQTRAKVAAVKNNMRVVSMAIEMCATDTNSYPKAVTWNLPCKVLFQTDDCTSSLLSVKYDLFLPETSGGAELLFGDLVYFNHSMMVDLLEVQGITWDEATTETWIRAKEDAGEWSLHSVGPDRVLEGPNWVRMAAVADTASAPYANSDGWTSWCDGSTTGISPCTAPPHEYTDWAYFRDYDPTNGTVSEGNIFRTQRSTAGFGVDPYYYRPEPQP
jgi:prepilin-type N-terminal cleavage/methylation domain-containing protein